ncbi:MAG: hypothetical protein CfClM3_0436 [Methanobrevibacter sp. CfCl-M3]
MNLYKIFSVLFLVFLITGLSGNVFATSEAGLPDNTSPEVKKLISYIQTKAGCSVGEADLVVEMLSDQLSGREYETLLGYVCYPNNKTSFDPNYTYKDYFQNPRNKAILERIDGDMVRFGSMSHEEKLTYLKHTENNFGVELDKVLSSDFGKMNYVLNRVNVGSLVDTIDNNTNTSHSVGSMKKAGENIDTVLKSKADELAKAEMEYEIIKIDNPDALDGITPANLDKANFTGEFNNSLNNLAATLDTMEDVNMRAGGGLVGFGVVVLGIGILATIFGAGHIGVVVIVLGSAMVATGTALLINMGVIGNTQHKIKSIINNI